MALQDSFPPVLFVTMTKDSGPQEAKQEAIAHRQAMERLHYTFVDKGAESEQPAVDDEEGSEEEEEEGSE
ncbi:unnamed protein product [Vitrella brassicaformis CCMP3155]|uniref:Uncharacterized protein n=1 Tax=Vitrella brassicaformis (strain CCMP3155) TaxID=1169540 RepID=A0A0G4F7A3_VITBC|nr:unnamed protein product [Vitrella brassicaformis CCMP3155]|eukprot:CEM07892.1 unnamed protein product [Vitrella brassicaformis CCMP3155]